MVNSTNQVFLHSDVLAQKRRCLSCHFPIKMIIKDKLSHECASDNVVAESTVQHLKKPQTVVGPENSGVLVK